MTYSSNVLLETNRADGDWADFLARSGRVFRVFDKQDSGCVSYGVEAGGRRLFVKHAGAPETAAFLRRAERINRSFRHPLLPELLNAFPAGAGYALVYEWVDGEVLGTPEFPGEQGRNDPRSPHYRFRQLPAECIVCALNAVYECHVRLEEHGFVAEDFYDGCMIYDFGRHRLHLCDLDCYHEGPYTLDRERCFGSTRFMAPEEWRRGCLIDSRTNVYTMGAAAFVFLADGSRREADWRASAKLYEEAAKAVSDGREARYGTVAEFYAAWLGAQPA
ncbi:serine/threonine protein kinase [Paenibacillus humicola]|uniref:serine/threonine protein kinase n=1 Tax=Paenibacillus humicola TaxID=3110540 RepID=UPI00237C4499|nr:serine/threonine protein kinase [Paenibacillus humicola]